MAKKRKAKKNSKIGDLLLALSGMLGIVVFVLMFMTKIRIEVSFGDYYKGGSDVAWKDLFFGTTTTIFGQTQQVAKGTILGFIAYLAILLAGLFSLITMFTKNRNLGAILAFVCGLIMVGFGVVIFFLPNLYASQNGISVDYVKLTFVPILAGILAVLGGLCSVGGAIAKKA